MRCCGCGGSWCHGKLGALRGGGCGWWCHKLWSSTLDINRPSRSAVRFRSTWFSFTLALLGSFPKYLCSLLCKAGYLRDFSFLFLSCLLRSHKGQPLSLKPHAYGGQRSTLGVTSQEPSSFLLFVLRQGLSWDPGLPLDPDRSSCLCLPNTGIVYAWLFKCEF